MPKVQKTPPWSKGANDPAMSESCEFLAPDIDNVSDLHGNPADAELELFIGGNQQQRYRRVSSPASELKSKIFYETLPPRILRK